MARYVALLRAVNVGGTGSLRMADLKAICRKAGFADVETYIASGNVVFASKASASKVKAELERRLHDHTGKPIGVMVRSAREITRVLKANPFPKTEPKHTYVVFLDRRVPADWKSGVSGQADERIEARGKELFVYYSSGMGRSKLKIAAAKTGTARNLNTVTALAEMVSTA